MRKLVKVVGGLIFDKDKLLIARRKDQKEHPLKWEFPGGKVLLNEKIDTAIARELNEELSITISNPKYLMDYNFSYSQTKSVHLFFFKITSFYGEITKKVHEDLKWIYTKDLKYYDFLAGDNQIIDYIINNDINL